jgi:hypothetical protein
MLLFATLVSESRLNINNLRDSYSRCKCLIESGKNCHGFYCGIVEDSVGIQFHLGNCGMTEQGDSLYTYQDHLLGTATSRVIYVKNSLSIWSAKEDYVCQRDTIYFEVLGEFA